jgi:hypothetical protein
MSKRNTQSTYKENTSFEYVPSVEILSTVRNHTEVIQMTPSPVIDASLLLPFSPCSPWLFCIGYQRTPIPNIAPRPPYLPGNVEFSGGPIVRFSPRMAAAPMFSQ